jgi:hypothetical protein
LLLTDFAISGSSRICKRLGITFGSQTIPARSLDSVYRLWFLSGLAGEEVWAAAEHYRFDPVVGFWGVCNCLDLLSAGDSERSGGFAGKVSA